MNLKKGEAFEERERETERKSEKKETENTRIKNI